MKDIIIHAKNSSLKDIEHEIEKLKKENYVLLKDIESKQLLIESRLTCEICDDIFESSRDKQVHLETFHRKQHLSRECTKCENISKESERLNIDFILVKDFAKEMMDEKKAHKMICDFSKNCSHTSSCHVKCYYNDKEFVMPESNSEDSDDSDVADESDSDESDFDESDDNIDDTNEIDADQSSSKVSYNQESDTENEVYNQKNNLKCEKCDFCAKSLAGLSNHGKAKHEIQFAECEIKTTAKVQLKLHKAETHR